MARNVKVGPSKPARYEHKNSRTKQGRSFDSAGKSHDKAVTGRRGELNNLFLNEKRVQVNADAQPPMVPMSRNTPTQTTRFNQKYPEKENQ